MKTGRSFVYWVVLLFAIIVIIELTLRADQIIFTYNLNENLLLGNYPKLTPGLFLLSGLVFLTVYFYKKSIVRLSALIFPLLLMVCVGLNLQSFYAIDQGNVWHLQRLPTNNLIDLLQASHDRLSTRPVYVVIEDHFKGRTLVSPPELLNDVGLSPEHLLSWGSLAHVETPMFDSNLSEQEVAMLLSMEHIELQVTGGKKYVFITGSSLSTDPLLITRFDGQIFIVPYSILPDRELTH